MSLWGQSMIDKVQKDECVLCKACSQICPLNCINFTEEYLSNAEHGRYAFQI